MAESRNEFTVLNYESLKQAIIDGAVRYNQARVEGNSPPDIYTKFDCNSYGYGEKGRIRGIKAEKYARAIQSINHINILALAIAIFDSSSKWLATEIAYQMIKGSVTYEMNIGYSDADITYGAISSEVFDQTYLSDNRFHRTSYISASEAGGIAKTNKRESAKLLLLEEALLRYPDVTDMAEEELVQGCLDINRSSHITFFRKVEAIKSSLHDVDNEEINYEIFAMELSQIF